jgi:hypothetical protein
MVYGHKDLRIGWNDTVKNILQGNRLDYSRTTLFYALIRILRALDLPKNNLYF